MNDAKKAVREHVVEHVDGLIRDKHSHGSWVIMTCPLCEEEGKGRGKLNVNVADGWFFCFRCGIKGPVPELKQTSDALFALFSAEEESPAKRAPGLPEDFIPLFDPETGSEVCGPAYHKAAWRYVKSRGIDRETARKAMIGSAVCGPHKNMTPRVVIPAFGWDNWCVGYSAREIPGWKPEPQAFFEAIEGSMRVGKQLPLSHVPKYFKPPGFDRNELFMAEDLKIETTAPVYIVEGAFDALPLLGDAVAVWGKPSDEQIVLIGEHVRRPVVFAGDRDTQGENAVNAASLIRIRPDLKVGQLVWTNMPPKISDIGEMMEHEGMTRKKARELLERSTWVMSSATE